MMTDLPYSYGWERETIPFASVTASVSSNAYLTIYTQSTAAFKIHNGEKVYITDEEKKFLDEQWKIEEAKRVLFRKYEFSRLSQVE